MVKDITENSEGEINRDYNLGAIIFSAVGLFIFIKGLQPFLINISTIFNEPDFGWATQGYDNEALSRTYQAIITGGLEIVLGFLFSSAGKQFRNGGLNFGIGHKSIQPAG